MSVLIHAQTGHVPMSQFSVSGNATYQALIVRPDRLDNTPDYFWDQGGTTPVIRAYAISCPICSFA